MKSTEQTASSTSFLSSIINDVDASAATASQPVSVNTATEPKESDSTSPSVLSSLMKILADGNENNAPASTSFKQPRSPAPKVTIPASNANAHSQRSSKQGEKKASFLSQLLVDDFNDASTSAPGEQVADNNPVDAALKLFGKFLVEEPQGKKSQTQVHETVYSKPSEKIASKPESTLLKIISQALNDNSEDASGNESILRFTSLLEKFLVSEDSNERKGTHPNPASSESTFTERAENVRILSEKIQEQLKQKINANRLSAIFNDVADNDAAPKSTSDVETFFFDVYQFVSNSFLVQDEQDKSEKVVKPTSKTSQLSGAANYVSEADTKTHPLIKSMGYIKSALVEDNEQAATQNQPDLVSSLGLDSVYQSVKTFMVPDPEDIQEKPQAPVEAQRVFETKATEDGKAFEYTSIKKALESILVDGEGDNVEFSSHPAFNSIYDLLKTVMVDTDEQVKEAKPKSRSTSYKPAAESLLKSLLVESEGASEGIDASKKLKWLTDSVQGVLAEADSNPEKKTPAPKHSKQTSSSFLDSVLVPSDQTGQNVDLSKQFGWISDALKPYLADSDKSSSSEAPKSTSIFQSSKDASVDVSAKLKWLKNGIQNILVEDTNGYYSSGSDFADSSLNSLYESLQNILVDDKSGPYKTASYKPSKRGENVLAKVLEKLNSVLPDSDDTTYLWKKTGSSLNDFLVSDDGSAPPVAAKHAYKKSSSVAQNNGLAYTEKLLKSVKESVSSVLVEDETLGGPIEFGSSELIDKLNSIISGLLVQQDAGQSAKVVKGIPTAAIPTENHPLKSTSKVCGNGIQNALFEHGLSAWHIASQPGSRCKVHVASRDKSLDNAVVIDQDGPGAIVIYQTFGPVRKSDILNVQWQLLQHSSGESHWSDNSLFGLSTGRQGSHGFRVDIMDADVLSDEGQWFVSKPNDYVLSQVVAPESVDHNKKAKTVRHTHTVELDRFVGREVVVAVRLSSALGPLKIGLDQISISNANCAGIVDSSNELSRVNWHDLEPACGKVCQQKY